METILFICSHDYEDDGLLEALDGRVIMLSDEPITVLTDGLWSLGRAAIRYANDNGLDLIVMRQREGLEKHLNRLIGAADKVYLGTRTGEDDWSRKVIGLAKSVKKNVFISYEGGESDAITYEEAECRQASFA